MRFSSLLSGTDKLSQTHSCPLAEIVEPLPFLSALSAEARHAAEHNVFFKTVMSRYVFKVFQLPVLDPSQEQSPLTHSL